MESESTDTWLAVLGRHCYVFSKLSKILTEFVEKKFLYHQGE